MRDFDDEVGGRKIPSVFDKYSRPGDSITAPLKGKPVVRNVTDWKTGEVRTFAGGEPMTQYVIEIATEQREAAIEGDDGTRRLYVKGRNKKRLKEAIKAAGLRTLNEGDVITDTYAREDAETNEKVHEYKIKPGPNAARLDAPAMAGALPVDKSTANDEPPF